MSPVRTPGGYSTERTVDDVTVILSKVSGATWAARLATDGTEIGRAARQMTGGWNVRDAEGHRLGNFADLDEACRMLLARRP